MLSILKSFGLIGINGYPLDVEVDINIGLPSYETVGLADTAIKESRERVRSAIKNSGYNYPMERITVNLAPADKKKEGPVYDIAIAVGIIAASEQIKTDNLKKYIYFGELSLDGNVRMINGLLPLLISAREFGFKDVIIPLDNSREASFIEGLNIYPVKNLSQLVKYLKSEINIDKLENSVWYNNDTIINYNYDFCMVKGQESAKRALEIAVSGGHNVLMIGPPGAGKTMLSKCIPSIMPPMTFDEALETTKIHSIAGELDKNQGIVKCRPFRTPHHTASMPALIGGGKNSKPGEISLAHNGVLFLDEMPEYPRHTLETLRQPLEDGTITVARAAQTVEYPAKFMLVASMNPCQCGNFGSKILQCRCTQSQIIKYLSKLSGPLLDRIDIHIEVDSVKFEDLKSGNEGEKSEDIKKRVDNARKLQQQRFSGDNIYSNSHMQPAHIKKYCVLDNESENLLKAAFDNLKLSARAYTRILKVARTIADIENSENIKVGHIAEAIQYRTLDRKYRNFL